MSERDQSQSVSQAVQELSAKVATWEEALAAWEESVGESVGRTLEEGRKQAEERSRSEGREWMEAARAWRAAMQSQIQSYAALIERQAWLTDRQETVSGPWVWEWSRREWGALLLVALLGAGAMAVYYESGPGKELRQENAELRQKVAQYERLWWKKATEEQRARILSQDAAPKE